MSGPLEIYGKLASDICERVAVADFEGWAKLTRSDRVVLSQRIFWAAVEALSAAPASPIGRPPGEPEASKSADRVEQLARMIAGYAGEFERAAELTHSIASLFAEVEAENAKLRAALEPFAVAEYVSGGWQGMGPCYIARTENEITSRDFEIASAALGDKSQ